MFGMGKNKQKVFFSLDAILKSKGMTRTKAAQITGLSRQTITTLARNPDRVRIETIEILCRELGIKPEDLFRTKE